MPDKTTRQYEAMFLFGTAASANLEGTLDRVRKLVESHGGDIILLKKFDERRLAYEVKKQKRGLYVICYYHAEPTANAAITREVNLSDDVLRLMIISADHLNQDEMEAVEPQKYEPFDPEAARPRRPAMASDATAAEGDDVADGGAPRGDEGSQRADAETAASASS
jgi:small subunit ribosomal protein S6